jgi:hypothetical protein
MRETRITGSLHFIDAQVGPLNAEQASVPLFGDSEFDFVTVTCQLDTGEHTHLCISLTLD